MNSYGVAKAPNQVWVTDIASIPTHEGWLYLAGHKDLFNGEIVGYAMGERMTKNLVSQSLFRAVSTKRPAAGLIHHSCFQSCVLASLPVWLPFFHKRFYPFLCILRGAQSGKKIVHALESFIVAGTVDQPVDALLADF